MVRPNLAVLEGTGDGGLSPSSQSLLEELATTLRVPHERALKMALTHTLACVQRRFPIYLQALDGEPPRPPIDHNRGSWHV